MLCVISFIYQYAVFEVITTIFKKTVSLSHVAWFQMPFMSYVEKNINSNYNDQVISSLSMPSNFGLKGHCL